jgi:hypothetical protein
VRSFSKYKSQGVQVPNLAQCRVLEPFLWEPNTSGSLDYYKWSQDLRSRIKAFQDFAQNYENKMMVNTKYQVINRGFKASTLSRWNKDPMVASVYRRVTDPVASKEPGMLNVDVLIYTFGRPNYYRAHCTGDLDDPDCDEPALLLLNGYLHRVFRNLGYDQIMNSNKDMAPFKAGSYPYYAVTKIKYSKMGLMPEKMTTLIPV